MYVDDHAWRIAGTFPTQDEIPAEVVGNPSWLTAHVARSFTIDTVDAMTAQSAGEGGGPPSGLIHA